MDIRLGFDIGGTNVRAGIFDMAADKISMHAHAPFPIGKGPHALVAAMEGMAGGFARQLGIALADFRSVGIGMPGTVRADLGVLVSACNLHLDGMPVADMVRERFPGAKVFIANDADAAALGEKHAGAFRGSDSGLLITIGTGIGGGLIHGGRIFPGGLGVGTELGHITLQHGGPMCACGNRGCAEALCAAAWLERQGRRCCQDYPMSAISIQAGGRPENVTAKIVLDAAREGDGIARQVFEEYADNLASLVSTCCFIYAPRVIALGGGVSAIGDFLIDAVSERVYRLVRKSYRPERIITAMLGSDAGIVGAAVLPEYA